MKLRIHGNALRLRLNQAEVAQFSKTGFLEEALEFGRGARLAYALESSSTIDSPRALFANGCVRVQVPYRAGLEWATTDQTAISGDGPVSITVEKDFQCLHSEGPRDPRAYPNPQERSLDPAPEETARSAAPGPHRRS